MKTKYHLEVYEPEDIRTVAFSVESETPFGAIAVGDLLWHGSLLQSARLEVTKIEHLFWEGGGLNTHKICIQTKATKL
ncbi:hypothetical protein [Xanthobacter autotrophicus]|uniref:hypothetical protein n=1 Tax=Xanthobacter autotrophicus TaxID=280 RepID=UPI0024A7888E|nr:hypothetical protein [Xanthobacter autotrophicus]MDI4657235.1 hypothetical protein [Xanthobacter autotrophicus]